MIMCTPTSISTIDASALQLRMKTHVVRDSVYIKLMWNDKTPIILSSKVHIIQYKPVYDIYGNISMTLSENNDSDEFHVLKKIEDNICNHQKIQKHTYSKTYIPSVNFEKRYWKLRSRTTDIYWFDKHNKCIEDMSFLRSLTPPFRVRVIVRLDNVWITKYCYGLSFALHQVQVHDEGFYLSKSMFTITEEIFQDDNKYKKMLKVGVPLQAVRTKMVLDGLDENTISRMLGAPSHQTPPSGVPPPPRLPPPPPKMPPPPPPLFNIHKNAIANPIDMTGILKDINGGNFKLKKHHTNHNKDSKQFRVNLTDLLNVRNSLKPLTKVYHSHYIALQPLE